AEEVDVAVRGEADPRVGGALEVAAVGRGAPGAERDLRDDDLGPASPAVDAHPGDETAGPAVRPPILLPAAPDVAGVEGVDAYDRLALAVRDVGHGLAGHVVRRARGEGAGPRDLDERVEDEPRRIGPHGR